MGHSIRSGPSSFMAIYFTADTHFSHKNIIEYCKRPFKEIDEMDQALIDNWNSVVADGDSVYHLGDFSIGRNPPDYYLSKLKGHIYLVFGNHDKKIINLLAGRNYRDKITFLGALTHIQTNDQFIVLCHYAMRTWHKKPFGAWQLYGHSHGTLPDDPTCLSMDVGVDVWGFKPITFDKVQEVMDLKLKKYLRL